MWKSFLARLQEPSTYAGIAAIAYGAGEVFKIKEAAQVADAIGGAGQAVASGADPITAAIVGIGGLLSVFLRERGGK